MSASRLTIEQLAAIGAVAVEATSLDSYFENRIWTLCGMDEKTGPIFTGDGMSLGARTSMLRSVVNVKTNDAEALENFKWAFDSLTTLITARNDLVHGEWINDPKVQNQLIAYSEPGHVIAKRPRKQTVGVHADDALLIAIKFNLMQRIFRRLFYDHFPRFAVPFGGLGPSPDRPFQQLRQDYKTL